MIDYIKMSTLIQHEDVILRDLCENQLKEFESDCLLKFAKAVFPITPSTDTFAVISNNIFTYYLIKITRNFTYEQIDSQILKKAAEFGQNFEAKVKMMIKGKFMRIIKEKIQRDQQKQKGSSLILLNPIEQTKQRVDDLTQTQESSKLKTPSKIDHKALITSKSAEEMTISKSGKGEVQMKKPSRPDTDIVIDLNDKNLCICGKSLIEPLSNQGTFVCTECESKFHIECMKKGKNPKACQLCHLKRMLPNRVVKKTLFIGLLKKGKRRHEISINIQKIDAFNTPYKMQLRCLRLKQHTQNMILFPDAANIVFNDHFSKQFTPLHRQSSLKYRKDEPLQVKSLNIKAKQNKVTITQKINNGKISKDERIQVQNHLFGVFLIEEKKVETLIHEIRSDGLITLQESKKLLMINFGVSHDELSLQTLQIPLTCCLTTQRIKYPVRGSQCTHFQCFDLKNFLTLTSSTSCPRWQCPLCRKPVYLFNLDCILLAILEDHKKTGATQVMFYKTGEEFSLLVNDKAVSDSFYNLKDLQIEIKGKRPPSPLPQEDEKEKKKKVKGLMPEDAQIIDLD